MRLDSGQKIRDKAERHSHSLPHYKIMILVIFLYSEYFQILPLAHGARYLLYDQNMDSFQYDPLDLDGPAFRLVCLYHGEGPDIHCELFQAWLYPEESAISYEALSYTWGSIEIVENVQMNGKLLGITLNLYLALQHLRFRDEDRILWVDGICIDQANDKERGHQVRHMGDIYKQAERVIFWLGQPTYETNVILDSLHQLQKESTRHPYRTWELSDPRWVELWSIVQPGLEHRYPDLPSRQRQGLEELLNRPWFRRVWILQEVANARAGIVCCGQKSVSAHIFPLAPLLIDMLPNAQTQAVLDIMPGPSRTGTWWNMNRDLYTILRKFRASEAQLPCDMVFALLGISSDAHDTDMLRPDYEKSETQIIHDVVRFLFGDHIYHTEGSYFPFLRNLLRNLELLNNLFLQHYMELENIMNLEDILKWRRFGVSETDITSAARDTIMAERQCLGYDSKRTPAVRSPSRRNLEIFVKSERWPVPVGRIISTFLLDSGKPAGKDEESEEDEEDYEYLERADRRLIYLWCHMRILESFLQERGYKTDLAEEFIPRIISDSYHNPEVIGFILRQGGDDIMITDAVLIALLRTDLITQKSDKILVQKQGQVIKITEAALKSIASNTGYGLQLLRILLRQRGNEIQITEGVLSAAVLNEIYGAKLIKLLLRKRGKEIHITQGVLDAAASNRCCGSEVVEVLSTKMQSEQDQRYSAHSRKARFIHHLSGFGNLMKQYLEPTPQQETDDE